jgi:hypothetical protein
MWCELHSANFAGMRSKMASKKNAADRASLGRLIFNQSPVVRCYLSMMWGGVLCMSLGCQCSPWTNSYAQLIDRINDHSPQCDRCYSPRFDLTRIGKADWCHGVNRQLCQCRCEENGSFETGCGDQIYPPSYPFVFPTDRLGTVGRPTSPSESPNSIPAAPAPLR